MSLCDWWVTMWVETFGFTADHCEHVCIDSCYSLYILKERVCDQLLQNSKSSGKKMFWKQLVTVQKNVPFLFQCFCLSVLVFLKLFILTIDRVLLSLFAYCSFRNCGLLIHLHPSSIKCIFWKINCQRIFFYSWEFNCSWRFPEDTTK